MSSNGNSVIGNASCDERMNKMVEKSFNFLLVIRWENFCTWNALDDFILAIQSVFHFHFYFSMILITNDAILPRLKCRCVFVLLSDSGCDSSQSLCDGISVWRVAMCANTHSQNFAWLYALCICAATDASLDAFLFDNTCTYTYTHKRACTHAQTLSTEWRTSDALR